MADVEARARRAPALRRPLEELPDATDGLSGTERRAMQAIAAGARTPAAAFVAVQQLEEAPFLGDAWYYGALEALGRGPARLVETDEGATVPGRPRSATDRRSRDLRSD